MSILLLQVLNETSLWWFNQTQHIIPNAVVSSPDRNVTIAKKCSVFPVEFVGKPLLFYHPLAVASKDSSWIAVIGCCWLL